MKLTELSRLLIHSTSAGTIKALAETGQLPDTLTKAQAFRQFGRTNVERWLQEGLIHTTQMGSKSSRKNIDRLKLEAVARASNRITYLPVTERQAR